MKNIGTTRQTVSKWERGETTPEMNKLLSLSKLFDVSLDELINENNELAKIVNVRYINITLNTKTSTLSKNVLN